MIIFYKIFLLLYFVFQGLLTPKMVFIYFLYFFFENALEERGGNTVNRDSILPGLIKLKTVLSVE